MNYWLVKSEPEKWSWDAQVKAKTTFWDGVRNYMAANFMKAMKIGDLVFFYGFGHVAIYVGNGIVIHAPHTGLSVEFASMSSMGPIAAARVPG